MSISWRGRVIRAAALIGVVILAACSNGSSSITRGSSPGALGSTETSADQLRAGDKPVIVGLIDKGSEGPYRQGADFGAVDTGELEADASAFSGTVINATWAQLEPRPDTFDFSVIDKSLAAIASYNHQHPGSIVGARLRVFAAFAAPGWAKTLDGSPVTVTATAGDRGGTLGRWWESHYRAAWAGLQAALARRYDANALVREVTVSSCSTLTAEPFVMAPAVLKSASLLGWTTSAQQACLDGAFGDYAGWHRTAVYYPFNPLPGDPSATTEVMKRCAQSGATTGPRCILANNALSPAAATTSRSAPVYQQIDALWQADPTDTSVGFQMNAPTPSLYCASIQVAVAHHARSVELWPSVGRQAGFATITIATLNDWSGALHTRQAPSCT